MHALTNKTYGKLPGRKQEKGRVRSSPSFTLTIEKRCLHAAACHYSAVAICAICTTERQPTPEYACTRCVQYIECAVNARGTHSPAGILSQLQAAAGIAGWHGDEGVACNLHAIWSAVPCICGGSKQKEAAFYNQLGFLCMLASYSGQQRKKQYEMAS